MKLNKRAFFTMLALTAMISAPLFAQAGPSVCAPSLNRAIASDSELITIVETANEIAGRLPSRARVAGIEDTDDRLYMTMILDHVEAAQRADRMSPEELEKFAESIRSSVASAQIGIATCQVADPVGEIGAVGGVRAQAAGCSCVQKCYREWKANLATCNGGYWCQVGFNLLFELCLADCLVPG